MNNLTLQDCIDFEFYIKNENSAYRQTAFLASRYYKLPYNDILNLPMPYFNKMAKEIEDYMGKNQITSDMIQKKIKEIKKKEEEKTITNRFKIMDL